MSIELTVCYELNVESARLRRSTDPNEHESKVKILLEFRLAVIFQNGDWFFKKLSEYTEYERIVLLAP